MVMVVTDRSPFRETARSVPSGPRVPVEIRVDVGDPFECYRRARDGPGGAFLETTGGQRGWEYFADDSLDRLVVGPAATGDGDSPTLASLEGLLDGERLARGDCDAPSPCCAIGWLSSVVARELESFPGDAEAYHPRVSAGIVHDSDPQAEYREPLDEARALVNAVDDALASRVSMEVAE